MIDIQISDLFEANGTAVSLGCVHCQVEVRNDHRDLEPALQSYIHERALQLESTGIAEVAPVAAARKAYRALGKDPGRYRVSSEALLRRIRQGKELYRVNTVVDTNNLVSLQTGLSAGCYDFSRLNPPLVLRVGREGESYRGIGKGELNVANLPVMTDDKGPFGSPTSDSERSMVDAETRELLLVLYAFSHEPEMEKHLEFTVEQLQRFCAAVEIETAVFRSG